MRPIFQDAFLKQQKVTNLYFLLTSCMVNGSEIESQRDNAMATTSVPYIKQNFKGMLHISERCQPRHTSCVYGEQQLYLSSREAEQAAP